MTPANRTKFDALGNKLKQAAKANDNADSALFTILDTIEFLTQMAKDFHFRPEANK